MKMKTIINEDQVTRNYLSKVRQLREDGQPIQPIQDGQPVQTAEPTQNTQTNENEIVIGKDNENFIEVIQNIRKFVGAVKTDENAMIIYPKENDVVFSGVITDLNNLKFQFRYNDQSGGLYIWTDSMLLTKEMVDKLNKLIIIRDQWKTYWSNNISEYSEQK
jgi:hypothetical protein